jgi:branched-chain amino acid transport system ATP-binding protein
MTSDDVLEVRALSKNFGGLKAVQEISFSARSGEVLGIIGPNGAGKTTLFNLITRTIPATFGSVAFRGTDISRSSVDEVARLGLVRTFQTTSVFKGQSVAENLCRGYVFCKYGRPSRLLRLVKLKDVRQAAMHKSDEILTFLNLKNSADVCAGNLAYGLQRILGIGIALATEPKMMLMDEPAAGLNPSEKAEMAEIVEKLRSELKIDIALVEHDMRMVMSICDRLLVLDHGRQIALGTPAQVQADQSVIDAYLGVDHEFA